MIGVFFAAQSIGVLIWSPVVGKTLEKVGRTLYLVGGFILMGACFACFGLCGLMDNPTTLIMIAVGLRFLQGVASASIQTSCFAIATNDYPEHKNQLVGLVESFAGVGATIGPVLGSTLYATMGFSGTFYFYGAMNVVWGIVTWMILPKTNKSEFSE